ncbi:ribosomal RNA small subunit methyltransferase A [candidate division KSB3 bacterium]|uniref:Ribosomal RNA small subunit methyltransferase A n=1 Tax=candidate division KSB3 bacterium TaxID=2044937 RepID=A0A9D5JWW9_9BACT|nr:ribosomal RNA small subunit methyltransferase A [candidate division KSB3 bacterium]MBD3325623.1 ribosomal RNA small subunit methyltransferase A [candidate division KSB3 bacterium]
MAGGKNRQVRGRRGQHFLIDPTVITRILQVADIHPGETVVEIGPGTGNLTLALAEQSERLIAVEYDATLARDLSRTFSDQPHVQVVHADARTLCYDTLLASEASMGRQVKIVANLPYYAAVAIMMSVLQASHLFKTCTLMFQKEVAERITAVPGTKAYGSLSVLVQYYSDPVYHFTVPPQAFRPRPKVESAVIGLHVEHHVSLDVVDQPYFFQLVKAAFLARRKTLKNSLVKNRGDLFPEPLLQQALETLGLPARVRAEDLALEDFVSLSNVLIQMQQQA